METFRPKVVMWQPIKAQTQQAGLSDAMLGESLQALADNYYVVPAWVLSGTVRHVELTLSGYLAGISHLIPDIDEIRTRIVASLVNDPPSNMDALSKLAEAAGTEPFVVDQYLRVLENQGLVKVARAMGGSTRILRVNATLRRHLN